MFDIFVVVSEKILQEPKKIICKWCFFQSLAISKYRGGEIKNTLEGLKTSRKIG